MTTDLVPAPHSPPPRWLAVRRESDETLGATLAPDAPFAEWLAYTSAVLRLTRGLQWLIGDLLDQGERLYGEDFAQALAAADYADETVRCCGWVARRIPPVRRRTGLSWSHHREVASLDAPAADALLDRAAAEGLSSRDLRRLARPLPAPPQTLPERTQAADGATPDFDAWLASWCVPGGKESVLEGYRVKLSPISSPSALTSGQALRLSERLRRLAETGEDVQP